MLFCGTYAYLKQGRVFFKAAIPFALATVPGAFIGGYISAYFSGPGFSITFGITFITLRLSVSFKSSSKRANAMADQFDASMLTQRQMVLGVSLSFLVGFASILGIGGGVIHVPLMIFILGFPAHYRGGVLTTFVLMVSSSIGVVSHALLNHIVWTPALCIGLGAIVGAQIGAKISQKSGPQNYRDDTGIYHGSPGHTTRRTGPLSTCTPGFHVIAGVLSTRPLPFRGDFSRPTLTIQSLQLDRRWR